MLPKPPNGYLPKDEAEKLLQRFVMGAEMDAPTPLPKRAEPAQVDQFLKKILEQPEKLKNRHVGRIGELMRFFDLRGRAPQVKALLARQERELPQFFRSLTATTIVADLGDVAAQNDAVQYYTYLVRHRLAEGNYEGLVDTFFHLPKGTDPKIITEPLVARSASLRPNIATDDKAAVEYYKLDDMVNDRVPTVLKAKDRRHEIEELKSVQRRRQELIRCYLRVEKNGYIDLRLWAVMMLQRDCSGSNPAELAKEFQQMFQIIMDEARRRGGMTSDDQADLNKYATSCSRGARFYGGTLDEPQTEFADKHRNERQNDVLYWEPETDKQEGAETP